MEFGRGARVIASRTGRSFPAALVHLSLRNTRRYGGYIVHIGIVLIAVGLAGSGFNKDVEGPMPYRGHMQIGAYTLISQNVTQDDNANYSSQSAIIEVKKDGRTIDTLYPARRFYKASGQVESIVAIRSRPLEDLYLVYAGNDPSTNNPILHAYLNPLIMWIWIGAIVVALGILLALTPGRKPAASPATAAVRESEVVGAHS
jgi:cytochrome c-type biogenesis protein CcmF